MSSYLDTDAFLAENQARSSPLMTLMLMPPRRSCRALSCSKCRIWVISRAPGHNT
jgi:hypothetical protein